MHTYLTINEVCVRFGCCRGTIYNMLNRSEFPAPIRVGNNLRFAIADLEAWEQAQKQQATPAPQPAT